jgi:hypothetical protein
MSADDFERDSIQSEVDRQFSQRSEQAKITQIEHTMKIQEEMQAALIKQNTLLK